jgi:hypothetical protein
LIPYTTSNTIANIVNNNSFVNSNALSNILVGYQYLSNILSYSSPFFKLNFIYNSIAYIILFSSLSYSFYVTALSSDIESEPSNTVSYTNTINEFCNKNKPAV